MKTWEALTEVEDTLTELKILDKFGYSLIGLEAVGIVSRHFGERWSKTENDLEAGKIKPEHYAELAKNMIREFRSYRFQKQTEKKLAEKLDAMAQKRG